MNKREENIILGLIHFVKKLLYQLIKYYFVGLFKLKNILPRRISNFKAVFLTEEFFHLKFRGFGGYGMTLKYITDHFNTNGSDFKADVIYTPLVDIPQNTIEKHHHANVFIVPKKPKHYVLSYLDYGHKLFKNKTDIFITVDYFITYEKHILEFPSIPWIIWLKDPRDKTEWEKIASVPNEIPLYGQNSLENLLKAQERHIISLHSAIRASKPFNRKIVFGIELSTTLEIAKRQYHIPNLEAIVLPKPVDIPKEFIQIFSEKPSFLFLGRLDPIKRPWIFFELAKRFPDMDFYVAGQTHAGEIMEKIISKYQNIPNLKLLGHIDKQHKTLLLQKVWAVINTSVHEALPVSFLESFVYGKPVISCQNPDNLAQQFGIYTGELLGEGLDERNLNLFSEAINKFVYGNFDKNKVGQEARRYVEKVHSYSHYEENIKRIFLKNKNKSEYYLCS